MKYYLMFILLFTFACIDQKPQTTGETSSNTVETTDTGNEETGTTTTTTTTEESASTKDAETTTDSKVTNTTWKNNANELSHSQGKNVETATVL